MQKKNISLLIFCFVIAAPLLFAFVSSVSAADTTTTNNGMQYTLLEKLPGFENASGSDLPSYIKAVYGVGLAVIVLSALFMLSVGGFMYLTSAGNTSAMHTAKEVIFDSLIGLVIALTAYLLLNVINPDLVNINIKGLTALPTQPGAAAAPTAGACTGCVEVAGVNIKPVGQGCASPGPCKLNETFLNKLKALPASPSWWVTEAWPPTVTHKSVCHSNGTCADINLQSGVSDTNSVKNLYSAIRGAGLNTVYETFSDCSPYIAVGVRCDRFPTTTGSHFHVY